MNDKKQKHHVFSARTTVEGLAILNGLRKDQNVGWDDLIINAINRAYNVSIPRIPLKGPSLEERAKAKAEKETAKAAKAKKHADDKAVKAKIKADKAKETAKKKAKADKVKAEKAAAKIAKANETPATSEPILEPEPEETQES